MTRRPRVPRLGCAAAVAFCTSLGAAVQATTALSLTVIDAATGKPVPCFVYLKDPQGRPVRPGDLPFWNDHFACSGRASLPLAPGEYTVEIERGPEYRPASGAVSVEGGGEVHARFELKRLNDMRKRGWRPGELHVHRPLNEVELLLDGADLDVAPVITWWNARNMWADRPAPPELVPRTSSGRRYDVMGGEDEREGGALLFFGLKEPLPIQKASREYPASAAFLKEARKHAGLCVDIEKPFWWDVPVWLATGMVDSVGIANNHMNRSRMYETEAWGRPRDTASLPPPLGNGFWTQDIYYKILDAGIRLPPSAGSASGVLPNPVGYNRVYVHTGKDRSYQAWWDGLKAGRSFVTNGPLLEARANGKLPGTTFIGKPGKALTIRVTGALTGNDPLKAVEVIQNGAVVRTLSTRRAPLSTSLTFQAPGWFLVRALADNPKTFRFASTAPLYVAFPGQPDRISRSAVRFFADWLEERVTRIKLDDPAQRAEVLPHFYEARSWWKARAGKANTD